MVLASKVLASKVLGCRYGACLYVASMWCLPLCGACLYMVLASMVLASKVLAEWFPLFCPQVASILITEEFGAEAARHFRIAAELGHSEAQRKLALLLIEGRPDVTRDLNESSRWLDAAVAQACVYHARVRPQH
jgi:hypothetical protein